MNSFDERTFRQRLHAELGSLGISPAPVVAVSRRGRAIRARRRAVAGGLAAAAAVAVLAASLTGAPRSSPNTGVTLNAPNPTAPNGVFASGTADGHPWRLAVRNIAAHLGGPWCLPAVMLNGHDGDVLFPAAFPRSVLGWGWAVAVRGGNAAFGNPAILAKVPGLPGIGAAFTQVSPQVTRLLVYFPNNAYRYVRPVRVSACGQQFYLAGFAFTDPQRGVSHIMTFSTYRLQNGQMMGSLNAGNGLPAGVWTNRDYSRADLAASRAASPIGAGTVHGAAWGVKTALGLFGQCYTVTARAMGVSGQAEQCAPVAAPPPVTGLVFVPFPYGIGGLSGYAGLVNPRTAKVVVGLTNGRIPPVTPVDVTGRAYVAFAIPPGCQVTRLRLFDSAGHMFASTAALPPAR